MNKQVLRQLYLQKRKTLSAQEFKRRNETIFDASVSFLNARPTLSTIHIFSSIEEHFEINTLPIINWLHSRDKTVVLPKIGTGRSLSHHTVSPGEVLIKNSWGILEPNSKNTFSSSKLDLVFVPMICFDRSGSRIGYGGGYYDRFMSELKKDCLKVGLCMTPPLDNIPYTNQHDISLDYCITHLGVYHF